MSLGIVNLYFWYCHASWDTITDIIIFLMPIPQITTLNLRKMQKLGLILVFLTGALYVIHDLFKTPADDSVYSSRASCA